jgi:hypothetical protein
MDLFDLNNASKDQLSAELNHTSGDSLHTSTNCAEGRRIDGRIHGLRIRIVVIKQVEHLGSKFKGARFAEIKGFGGGKIHVNEARQAEGVSSGGGAESSKLCRSEGCRIEPLIPGSLAGVQVAALPENGVGPRGDAGAGDVEI